MAILKIARMGHPVLRRPADPVDDPTAPEIRRLVADMLETLEDIGGLGLAAPQVHQPRRLVIFHQPASRVAEDDEGDEEDGGPLDLTVLVNPVIEPLGEKIDLDWEACLSVPGLRGLVPRHGHIRYSGLDLRGRAVQREAEGLHARVVQHECDHLDGVLYPQRMPDLRWLVFESEMKRVMAEMEEAPEAAE